MVESTGKLKQWDPTATDGSQRIFGVLEYGLNMEGYSNTNEDKFIGWIVVGGYVTSRALLIASNSDYGIVGDDEEFNVRALMGGNGAFSFDDDPLGLLNGNYSGVSIVTADATLGQEHMGTLLVTRGASGAVELTLPATAKKGQRFKVYNAADQNLTITAGTADTLVVFNDLAADSIALSTAGDLIGGSFEVIGDGTGWLVIPSTFADGVIVQTLTIAT
jgi:hypothetical protein